MTTQQAGIVGALVRSVAAIDGARRVGWARFFEEQARVDNLSGELARARGDAVLLSKLAGLALGFLNVADPRYARYLASEINIDNLLSYLPADALRRGREAGQRCHDADDSPLARAKAQAKRHRTGMGRNLFDKARKQETQKLAKEYGFAGTHEMKRWLDLYRWSQEGFA